MKEIKQMTLFVRKGTLVQTLKELIEDERVGEITVMDYTNCINDIESEFVLSFKIDEDNNAKNNMER